MVEACKNQTDDYDENVDIYAQTVIVNEEANGYRFPTEAEWEYAAMGGENYKYPGSNDPNEVGWYRGNSGSETHGIGQKKSNGYGLYDMSGFLPLQEQPLLSQQQPRCSFFQICSPEFLIP